MAKRVRKVAATVEVSALVRGGRGGHRKLWAFGYADLAHVLGCEEWAVRRQVQRGLLDPLDLVALARAVTAAQAASSTS